jgi:hypothetical protein
MPKPPIDADYFDKVNYVIDAWTIACDAPWYIYVETLKPALLNAFITLITFGWDDVARGYARPPDPHSRRRSGKRGKGKGRGLRGIPELGEMGGRNLPGSSAARGATWSTGLKALWRIDSVAQMALFWWLVADVTIDFAFEFTSLLYETRWCQDAQRGRFSWQKGPREIVVAGVWNEIAFTDKDYEYPFPNWVVTFGNIGVKGATISFSIDWEPWNPALKPTSYSARLIDVNTGHVWGETGPIEADSDGKATHIITADVGRLSQFGVEGWCEPFAAYAADGAIVGIEDML